MYCSREYQLTSGFNQQYEKSTPKIKISSLNLRYIRVRGEYRHETFMIDVVMIKEIIKIDIDQTVEIGEYHLVVEYSMDRIIKIALGLTRTIEMTSGEEIIKGIWDQIKITEGKIIEVDKEEIIKVIIMKELGVGLKKDSIKKTSEETTEVVVVDLYQVQ